MREIPLNRGLVAIVDDEDFERVSRYKWTAYKAGKTFYAFRPAAEGESSKAGIQLHRFILGAPDGVLVDHRNRNGLDCRRGNMRLATHAQNLRNCAVRSDCRSGYKGVTIYQPKTRNRTKGKLWTARIQVDGNRRLVGYFNTPEEAAKAYDEAAIRLHGEFACLNFKQ